ncbi:aspartyl-phosphate phosphatase Spo0E family protein [Paenibacillus tarimensis]|nr:aspartyl-phosphate phosphatase Spo0E family protein [Paenibacillus tarimensis]MCF2942475.1 aspartyl-phosphate phosphatase Spo0E family protein [Paenibacillus tarimensis]
MERLRGKMNAAANRNQDVQHQEVLRLSQSLDGLIVQFMVEKRASQMKKSSV